MNDIIFIISAILLGYGCIASKFEKSTFKSLCVLVGFVGMFIAYMI